MFRRPLVWILAAFVLVCLLNTCVTNKMDRIFQDEVQGNASGKIEQIIKKENGTSMYLKDVTLQPLGANKYYCNKILVYYSENYNLRVGNHVALSGKIMKFQRPTNPGQFNELQYYKSNHIEYKMFAKQIQVTNSSFSRTRVLLDQIRMKMVSSYDRMLNDKEAGIIDAMLLGEKSLLNLELKELYQKSGISHILVISGVKYPILGLYQTLNRPVKWAFLEL